MTDHIQIEKSNGVLTLVMNRPDKKNALTDAMYKSLADAIENANDDSDVRAILLRSEGDLFTSGNDIGEFAAVAAGGGGLHNVARFIRAIATAAKPLIAAVQGRAVGIGTTMLLHCDHVVLAEDAQLTTPFVSLALVPEAASSLLLPQRIGHVRAFSMFALGEAVGAHDAVAWGLANKVVPNEELQETARNFAERLARQPLGALVATKKLMRATGPITAHMDTESKLFGERLSTGEAREAFTAFAERRAPDFSGFA
ncbi:enoyl-CoA hydratase [Sphingomonas sp. ERG5]|uniref:enoyl-CoA hydratase n=1 Tax=Sphingomonas sp. ERG5 TaxID=1381597 RepID=UPI00054B5A7E|nr:enoyl-CoA hydratase [Sphingomonas sp. ERG5]